MSASATFLACVTLPGAARRRRYLRLVTDGAAPGPECIAREIDDPFVAARGEQTPDLGRIVREAPPVSGGLEGPLAALGATFAPPFSPTKVLGVGRNFRDHAAELDNPVPERPLVFFKPPSCLVGSGNPVVLPAGDHRVDYEGELVAVVGRRLRNASAAEASAAVAGVCLGDDVTCRDLQRTDGQWTRAKGFDTFGPVGPFLRLVDGFDAVPQDARIRTFVGDGLRQDAPLSHMVFGVGEVLAHVSACMTLEPGDAVFLGTPAGVGPLAAGQVVRIECGGFDLGRLVHPVVGQAGPTA